MDFIKLKLGPVLSIILITLLILTTVLVIQHKGFYGVLTVMQGGRVYRETVDGLQFTVYLNKKTYTVNDEINLKVRIKNVTTKPIVYAAGDSSPTDKDNIYADIRGEEPHTSFIYVPYEGESFMQHGSTGDKNLYPKQSLSRDFIFFPKNYIIHAGSDKIVVGVSKGEYKAYLRVRLKQEDAQVTVPIIIAEFEGKVTSKEHAENIASQHQDIKDWITMKTIGLVTKSESGGYYILLNHGWTKVVWDTFVQTIGKPTYQVNTEQKDGYWNVVYTSELGKYPNRIEVKIDSKTGEIKSLEKFDK